MLLSAQVIKSGDDDLIFPLSHLKKNLKVLTVVIRLYHFPFRVAREVLLIHRRGNHQYQFTLKQNARTLVNDDFEDYRAVWIYQ